LEREQFNEAIKIITVSWPAGYTEEQIEMLFESVKLVSAASLRHALTEIVAKLNHKPSVAKIIADLDHAIQKAKQKNEDENFYSLPKCTFCDSSGVVSAKARNRLSSTWFAFKCNLCSRADMRSLTYPTWNKDYAQNYLTARQIYNIEQKIYSMGNISQFQSDDVLEHIIANQLAK
jgi:hypothetical protein